MSLSLGERRRLRRIERSLDGCDSRLASLYAIFNRLARADAMPAGERLRSRAAYAALRMMAGDPVQAAGYWPGTPLTGLASRAYVTSWCNARPPAKQHDRAGDDTAPLAEARRPRHRGGVRRLVSRARLRGLSF